MKIIKAGIIGGIIVWIWYAISWMALPWHQTTIQRFVDEEAVARVVKENAKVSGVYLIPTEYAETKEKGPMVFSSVYLSGMPSSMANAIVVSMVKDIVVACLVAWMLLQAVQLRYAGRICFVVVFALAAGISSQVALWNWWKFDQNFVLVGIADLVIGWFFASLVMARICKN